MDSRQLSLYLHIPFCSAVCHYCDFAKTANFNQDVVEHYFQRLECDLRAALAEVNSGFSSVFLGGGTPGLFAREYHSLLDLALRSSTPNIEVSLEANPLNLTHSNLQTWKSLGLNRLSVGVQSFNEDALRILTRDHSGLDACKYLRQATNYFENLNIDLIYGWPQQTLDQWRDDLHKAIDLGATHLSLYCLTYEYGTVFGRRQRRGLMQDAPVEFLADCYDLARELLASNGYGHDEISNWAKPGFTCVHNQGYWSDHFFLGLGAGAHGYLDQGSLGHRYSYSKNLQQFLRDGVRISDPRTSDDWVTEYVGSSLRSRWGTNLGLIKEKTGLKFRPNAQIQRAMNEKMINQVEDHLHLTPREWFREAGWCVEVLQSLLPSSY